MYDRQTESLWSQVRREAVTGPLTGEKLDVLPSTLTTWSKWQKKFPRTEVLSLDTGYARDYSQDPYADYYASREGFLAFFKPGPGEEEKALVAGIEIDGIAKAYPVELLRQQKKVSDMVSGKHIKLTYRPETDRISVAVEGEAELTPLVLYWFVWKGMYPDSELFSSE